MFFQSSSHISKDNTVGKWIDYYYSDLSLFDMIIEILGYGKQFAYAE
jgi:hypothetical protein